MKNFLLIGFAFSLLAGEEKPDIAQISEAFGHMLYENLERIDMKFDVARIIKGIQDASEGKESPLSKRDCFQAVETIQEENFQVQSKENLKQAEAFLLEQANEKGIVVLEKGKLQYRVIEEGKGSEVKPHFSPLVRYTMKKADGYLFGPPEEEFISLDEAIPGLKSGLIGMKEGEKRVIYVHPDLAYGPKGAIVLPPNLLLIFEVEILKANAK